MDIQDKELIKQGFDAISREFSIRTDSFQTVSNQVSVLSAEYKYTNTAITRMEIELSSLKKELSDQVKEFNGKINSFIVWAALGLGGGLLSIIIFFVQFIFGKIAK